MNGQQKTSPWVCVGMGCAAIAALGVVAVVVVSITGYRWAKQLEADMKDPQAREAKVKEVLGCERLPEGYHPMASVTIPFVMEMAMLSDRAPDAQGVVRGFGERGFLYFQFINLGKDQQELRDYFEGKTDDEEVLRRHNIDIHVRSTELIRRGVLKMEGHAVMYLAQRGTMDMSEGRSEGVNALMLVDCPGDSRQRMAIWFAPDPDPKTPVASANFSGSPADEGALREFMGRFRLCQKR